MSLNHYSASNIAAISELVDIPSTSLKRRRYSESKILGISQTDLAERPSREHYILGAGSFTSLGEAIFKGGPGVVILFVILSYF